MCVVNACGTSVSIYSYTCMSWIIGKLIKTYIYWVFRKSVSLLKCGKTQLMIILFLIQCLVVLAFLSHAQRNWQNCFVKSDLKAVQSEIDGFYIRLFTGWQRA